MKPIFLIGFMCSGKTTLGRALHKACDIRFIDLDEHIERKAGMTVKAIFASKGEQEFRRMEREALQELASETDVVVACGGGTPCQPGAMEMMNAHGTTVWLVPSEHRLVRRLMAGKHKRPLLSHIEKPEQMLEFAEEMMLRRKPFYSLAAHTFDTTMLETPAEVSATVDEFIRRFMS